MIAALLALLAAAATPAPVPHRLYACGSTSKGYVVGSPLPSPSGLVLLAAPPGAGWTQRGFVHPTVTAIDYDPRDPATLYLAAGNGCIRAAAGGAAWRILTDWRMTEVQDVSVDPAQPDHLYIALPDGIAYSPDQGRTWTHRDAGLRRKYTQALQVDRTRAGRVIAGNDTGIYLSADSALHWTPAAPAAELVTDVVQSRRDPRRWAATAQRGGLWLSSDGGVSWTNRRPAPPDQALYNASLDPHEPVRVAVCGWDAGVLVSEDFGATWADRSAGLPSRHVWRVAFDPDHRGRIWASVHEEAVFVSDDLGRTWRHSGLPGTIIRDFAFVPEAVR